MRRCNIAVLVALGLLTGFESSALPEDPCQSFPISLTASSLGTDAVLLEWEPMPEALEVEIHSPTAGGYLASVAPEASFFVDTTVPSCEPREYFVRITFDICEPLESNVVLGMAIEDGDSHAVADFDGDGMTDVAVFRPSDETWQWRTANGNEGISSWGLVTDTLITGDFDGDGKADPAIFRPETNTWWIKLSCGSLPVPVPWGLASDHPVPADYDGDGRTDIAIFRPSNGDWWVQQSGDGSALVFPSWGLSTDIPVPADYDGDGRADFAVFRPANGSWWIHKSSGQTVELVILGETLDVPVPADYTGNGKADVATYRSSTGTWSILEAGSAEPDTRTVLRPDGSPVTGGRPVPGDYDRDGIIDIAVVVDTHYWVMKSSKGGGLAVDVEDFGDDHDVPISWIALPRPAPEP